MRAGPPSRLSPVAGRSIGALAELKDEGKIRHIGVSNFSEAQFHAAMRVTPVMSVQNRYNATDRSSESMVDLCEQEWLAFLPWAPIQDADKNPAVVRATQQHGASPYQIVLAWLLARSPQMLPIPGSTTETIYRFQIRPVVLDGAEAMDRIFPAPEEPQER